MIITIPSSLSFTFNTSAGCAITAPTGFSTCTNSGFQVTLTATSNIGSGTTIWIPIGTFIVPLVVPTDSFEVLTKTVAGNNIDKNNATTLFIVDLKCDSPCEDCVSDSGANWALCTDCYFSGTNKYLHTTNNSCLTTCPTTGFFNNGNATEFFCTACDSNCLSCSTTSTNCLTCNTSTGAANPKFYSNKCYPSCPNTVLIKTYESSSN